MRGKTVLAVLFLLIAALALPMAVPQVALAASAWKDSKGPGKGDVSALAFDAARGILYEGSSRGVLKYQGGVWTDVGGGLSSYDVLSIACDSTRNVLYAGTYQNGVWRCTSPNGGSPSWTDISGTMSSNQIYYSLACDSVNNVLYSGGYPGGVWRYKNPDSGSPSWENTNGGLSTYWIYSLTYDSTRNIVYAGTYQHGVWRCTSPNGASPVWSDIGGASINTYIIDSLAFDQSRNLLYAGTGGYGVWRCTSPDGVSPAWFYTGGGLSGYYIYSLAYDSTSNILYAGTDSHGVWRCTSPDSGSPTWVDTGGGVSSYEIDSLACDSAHDVVYAGTWQHAVWQCANPDTSPNWTDIGGGVSSDTIYALACDTTRNLLYAGAGDQGVWRCASPFASPTWTGMPGGLTSSYTYSLAYDPTRNILYAGTGGGKVWRCANPNAAAAWEDTGGGGGGHGVLSLAYDPTRNILYAGSGGGGVWRCANPNAASPAWTNTGVDISSYYIESLAYDAARNVLYAGTGSHGVWRCKNPDSSPQGWTGTAGGVSSKDIHSLALDAARDLLYAGTGQGVWRCAGPDGASPAWTTTAIGLGSNTIDSLAYDSAHYVLYAGTYENGVWRCEDPDTGSPAWANTGGGVSSISIDSLAYDSAHYVLYVGTVEEGSWYNALPAVTSCSPTFAFQGQTLDVNIVGRDTDFAKGTSAASFGTGITVNSTTVSDPTHATANITITPGAALGARDVNVITGGETPGPLSGGFTINPVPVPTTTSISPASKIAGQPAFTLTVNGTNFVSGLSVVRWNGADRTTIYVSDTQLTATIPASDIAVAGTASVTVFNPAPGGGTSNAQTFTINNLVPTTTSISPTSKTAGQPAFTLTVNGTNFVAGSLVRWNGADRTTTYLSATQLTAAIPASDIAKAGAASVTVFNPTPGGGTSNAQTFTISPVPVPTIISISPISGQVGTTVYIDGAYFGASRGSSYVKFNNTRAAEADYVSWSTYEGESTSQILVNVPSGATTGPVTVTTDGGTSNRKTFTITASSTYYLAEGTCAYGFDTYVTIMNPNTSAVTASVTYMTKNGAKKVPDIKLPAMSQTVVNPRDALGATDFSTQVTCKEGKTICVDRTMTWTGPGAPSPEGHSSVGVTSPAKTWYLAEGSASWGFECYLLIQNPNPKAATCQVTYMIENLGPRTLTHTVPANSRATFSMAEDIPDVAIKDASIRVTSSLPVIPERAMYRNNRREGHDSIGTTTPATDYYLAEGAIGYDVGYITYVLVQNPNTTPTSVNLTYQTSSGQVPGPSFTMEPNSRHTIRVNDQLPSGTDVSTHVHGSQPIIAERAMYWGAGTSLGEACHDSVGMASPHRTFYLPDGESSNSYETWTLVQNPNSSPVNVQITYMTPSGKGNVTRTDSIPANSRKTFNMASHSGISGRAAIMVKSKTPGKKVMVERSMYWNNRGAGTDTIGGYSD